MMRNRIRHFGYRFYNDFLLPSRIDVFYDWLVLFKSSGYTVLGARAAADHMAGNSSGLENRILILRTDVDTDTRTARTLWRITKRIGISSSFYFRLSTIDRYLMREMYAAGDEVGYHYEELSTLGKHQGCRTASGLLCLLPTARTHFASNIQRIRQLTALPIDTAAAHGDWLNRRLGISNAEILQDITFRKTVGVVFEAYDNVVKQLSTSIIDRGAPYYWDPEDPRNACGRRDHVVYVTVHPRQWRARITVKLYENMLRVFEEIKYHTKALTHTTRSI
jgi:hypothetical protein